MGAIDPVILSQKSSNKLRCASIESYYNNNARDESNMAANSNSNNIRQSQLISNSMDIKCCDRDRDSSTGSVRMNSDNCDTIATNKCLSNTSSQPVKDSTLQQKAKKFLTLSSGGGSFGGGGSGLKPSVSTSCLFSEAESSNSSSSLDTNPSRASLTHEWKKLKTLNKCKECNLLVYFNGRECSFCGFVAHKKCLTVLVIKCSGQHVTSSDDLISLNNLSTYGNSLAQKFIKSPSQGEKQPGGITNNSYDQTSTGISRSSNQPKLTSTNRLPGGKSPPIKPVFGQPLDNENRQVVDFMRRFIYEIDTRGLDIKGIYRVSSIKSKVDRLCTYYDQNLSSLIDLTSFHPNIIANALKLYLRQLPEPLLTNSLYGQFIEVAKKYANSTIPSTPTPTKTLGLVADEDSGAKKLYQSHPSFSKPRKSLIHGITVTETLASTMNSAYNPMLIVEIKEIIEQLPPINQELIAIIMRHLRRVANMSFENQMSAKNLSIIFGPTLLSENNKSLAIVDNVHQARIIELMITWADQIFPQYENYESRAVIDVTPLPLDELDLEANGAGERRLSNKRDKAHSSNCNCPKHMALKSAKVDGDRSTNKQSDTRSELQELRRKFFTEPEQQQPPQTELNSPGNHRSPMTANTKEPGVKNQNSNRINDTQVSVPVIKVQSHFCKTLNKD